MQRLKTVKLYVHIGVTALGLTAAYPAFAQAQQSSPGAEQNSRPGSSQNPAPAPVPAPNLPNDSEQSTIGVPATVMATDKIESILGKEVKSPTGESMGRIVDIIVDRSVTVRGAVIDFGGFLGVGSRQIAVAWKALRFSQQNKSNVLIVDFTKDQLKAAPAYKAGEQVVLLHPPASTPAPADTSAASAPANPPTQAAPPETPAK
jgi:sporulation protein YlmC with PRC-barrel domain